MHACLPWKKGNSHKSISKEDVKRPLKINCRFEDNIKMAVK
jgi:hypothetical protein